VTEMHREPESSGCSTRSVLQPLQCTVARTLANPCTEMGVSSPPLGKKRGDQGVACDLLAQKRVPKAAELESGRHFRWQNVTKVRSCQPHHPSTWTVKPYPTASLAMDVRMSASAAMDLMEAPLLRKWRGTTAHLAI
jgi:hypothetical protein